MPNRWRASFGEHRQEIQRLRHAVDTRLRADLGETRALEADSFLDVRFEHALQNYRTFKTPYAQASALGRLLAVASSLVSSLVAAIAVHPEWARWLIFSFGAATVLTSAVFEMWRPGRKAASRFAGDDDLTREGWNYALRAGQYENLPNEQAWKRFIDQVQNVVQRTSQSDRDAFEALATTDDYPRDPGRHALGA